MTAQTRRTLLEVAPECCVACGDDLGKAIEPVAGVRSVQVLPAANAVLVEHDEKTTVNDIVQGAAVKGVQLTVADTQPREERPRPPWYQQPELLALLAAAALLALGVAGETLAGLERVAAGLYLVTLAVGGFYPAKSAIRALRRKRLTITTLLVVAAAGAVALGIYEEAALLVVVYSLGEVLEAYASDRARGAIRKLMALVPPIAQRERSEGTIEAVPVETLAPGDVVVVRPGERLPTDGDVVAGTSAIDQSPVTGESIPVEVSPGATVFGGTISGTGALKVRVTKQYRDTTLARIIRQVQQAQASKGQAERFADRFGAIYTPAIFALAAGVALVPLFAEGDFREWVYRALVVLTVSCSCGLVISVPVAVIAAISRAARLGILVKGGVYLERLAAVRVVVFDKTGTLTWGRPQLTDIVPINGSRAEDVLRLAASVELLSEHPLAGAIVTAAEERHLERVQAVDARALPGLGVEATVANEPVFVGRPGKDQSAEVNRLLQDLRAGGKTAVVVSKGSRVMGVLAVADEIRPEAAEAIRTLRALGLEHVVMLTGDNEATAAAIARTLGIDDWRASLLPDEKTAAIHDLIGRYGAVAMVGDGINDAPALATADVGIAMGAAGTDVALETADVALMADDLMKLPAAISLARRAMTNVHQNITLSLISVGFLVISALAGWLSLTTGLLLNEGSALLIIANGLRLLGPGVTGTPAQVDLGVPAPAASAR